MPTDAFNIRCPYLPAVVIGEEEERDDFDELLHLYEAGSLSYKIIACAQKNQKEFLRIQTYSQKKEKSFFSFFFDRSDGYELPDCCRMYLQRCRDDLMQLFKMDASKNSVLKTLTQRDRNGNCSLSFIDFELDTLPTQIEFDPFRNFFLKTMRKDVELIYGRIEPEQPSIWNTGRFMGI